MKIIILAPPLGWYFFQVAVLKSEHFLFHFLLWMYLNEHYSSLVHVENSRLLVVKIYEIFEFIIMKDP